MVNKYITPIRRRYKMAKKKKVVRKKKVTRKRKVVRKKKTVKRKATRRPAKKRKVVRKKKAATKKKRKANPAFMRSFKTTPILQAVVGTSSISRPQATKKIWEYIRKHNLQDKKNRRQINVGGTALGKMFPGKRSISMFDLPKGVGKHLKG